MRKGAGETTAVTAATARRRGRGEATDLAVDALLRLAHRLGPNARLPGLRALCAEFGVSPGTLNLALDRLEDRRVLLRRERSGVFVAPRLGRRDVRLICSPDFLLRTTVSPFWGLLIEKARGLAHDHGTDLTLAFALPYVPGLPEARPGEDASPLPDHLRREIASGVPDGVIAVGLPHATARWIEARGVPVVAFAGAARYIVSLSRRAMLERGAEALGRAGCRRVEAWLPAGSHWEECPRLDGDAFARAASATGFGSAKMARIAPPAASSVPAPPPRAGSPSIETGWSAAMARFGPGAASDRPRPEGLILPDDMIALGVLMALTALGLAPGRDVHIATHANAGSPVLLGWQSRLWRVEYDPAALVETLFGTLDALIDHAPASLTDAYAPPFVCDAPEVPDPARIPERYRLVFPRLLPPAADAA